MTRDEETLQALEDARELLSGIGTWTQRAMARTANGDKCDARNPNAVCWCALGALFLRSDSLSAGNAAMGELQKSCRGTVMEWNDVEGRTHEDVLDAYDRAINAVRYRLENKQ